MGIGSGNTLAEHVHPNLSESAALTCKAVDAMGQTVEKVLIKHGKPARYEKQNCPVL